MGWDREFDEPIRPPKGKPATLRDAANYITKHDALGWQAAMEALILVART